MKSPFKKGDYHDSDVGCKNTAYSVVALMAGVILGLGGLAFYGVSEFLARV
jgi:hypothetical protein